VGDVVGLVADEQRHPGVAQELAGGGDGDGTEPIDLAGLTGDDVAALERGRVGVEARVDRLARSVGHEIGERVSHVGSACFAPSLGSRLTEQQLGLGLQRGVEARGAVGRQGDIGTERAVLGPRVHRATAVQLASPCFVVGDRRRDDPGAMLLEPLDAPSLGRPQQRTLRRRVLARGVGDLARLELGELPGPERRIGRREIFEPLRRAQRRLRRAHGDPAHRRQQLPGAAMPPHPMRTRRVDTRRGQGLAGSADVLAAHEQLQEPRRARPIEHTGLEIAHDRLESVDRAADLLEHDWVLPVVGRPGAHRPKTEMVGRTITPVREAWCECIEHAFGLSRANRVLSTSGTDPINAGGIRARSNDVTLERCEERSWTRTGWRSWSKRSPGT
jgi:hypothetical protein